MGFLPFQLAAKKWERGATNRLPFPISIFFKGLYLKGKKEKRIALPGISLALSINQKLNRQHRKSEIPIDERGKELGMKKRDSVTSNLRNLMVRIAIGAIFVFMAGFNYRFHQG
jgi:hypothetical protein